MSGLFDYVHRSVPQGPSIPQLDGTGPAGLKYVEEVARPKSRSGNDQAARMYDLYNRSKTTLENEDQFDDVEEPEDVGNRRDRWDSSLHESGSTSVFEPHHQQPHVPAPQSASHIQDATNMQLGNSGLPNVTSHRTNDWVEEQAPVADKHRQRSSKEDLRRNATLNNQARNSNVAQTHGRNNHATPQDKAGRASSATRGNANVRTGPTFADTASVTTESTIHNGRPPFEYEDHQGQTRNEGSGWFQAIDVPAPPRPLVPILDNPDEDEYYKKQHQLAQHKSYKINQNTLSPPPQGQRKEAGSSKTPKPRPNTAAKAQGMKMATSEMTVPKAVPQQAFRGLAPHAQPPVQIEHYGRADEDATAAFIGGRAVLVGKLTMPVFGEGMQVESLQYGDDGYAAAPLARHSGYPAEHDVHNQVDEASYSLNADARSAPIGNYLQNQQAPTVRAAKLQGTAGQSKVELEFTGERILVDGRPADEAGHNEGVDNADDEQDSDQNHRADRQKRSHDDMTLDYEMKHLTKIDFADLQHESFDYDPTRETAEPYPELTTKQLVKKMEAVLNFQSHDRLTFLSNLAIDDWEEAGTWLLQSFTRVTEDLTKSREQRREIASRFEAEVARRHEEVTHQEEQVAGALAEMKQSGKQVIKNTPKKKGK